MFNGVKYTTRNIKSQKTVPTFAETVLLYDLYSPKGFNRLYLKIY